MYVKHLACTRAEWVLRKERTAAGIKHLRRLQARRVRGAQTRRLSSPARCCSQGVRTRQGISRIHHRCFGSVAASLESRAPLLQVSRNSVDQEQNKRFSFQVSRNSADQEHLDRDLPGKRALAWKVPLKTPEPSGKMASCMEGPPGKARDLPGKWPPAWKVPRKKAGPSGKMASGMEGPPEKRRAFRENGSWHGRSPCFERRPSGKTTYGVAFLI